MPHIAPVTAEPWGNGDLYAEAPPGLPSIGQIVLLLIVLPALAALLVILVDLTVQIEWGRPDSPMAAGLCITGAIGCGVGWILGALRASPHGHLHDAGQVVIAIGTLLGLGAGIWSGPVPPGLLRRRTAALLTARNDHPGRGPGC